MGRGRGKRRRSSLAAALGEFGFIAVHLWPFYVGVAALAFLIALIGGHDVAESGKTAATFATFAVVFGPLTWIWWNGAGDGITGAVLVFVTACVWMALLIVPAIWVLSWADA